MENVKFAQRIQNITSAKSMEIAEKARVFMRAGVDVIDFSWGEPDFDTPLKVKEACRKALDKNLTHYSASKGVDTLRQVICEQAQKDYGLEYSKNDDILVTPGAKQAIFYALLSLLEKDDEVLVPEPYWLSYRDAIELAGGKLESVTCRPENRFRLQPQDLRRKISNRTKVMILNNPCNPTGVLLDKEELNAIANVIKDTNIVVISDDIYNKLIFDGRKVTLFAAVPGMQDRTIVINGFSKAYAMTGWRLGYILAHKKFIDSMNKVHQHIATCACTFIQHAAEDAIKHCDADIERMCAEYQERRDLMAGLIGNFRDISCIKPEGTFYLWVDIRKTGFDSAAFADLLLDKAKIASIPGVAYGKSGEGFIRFAFTQSKKRIREGMERIREVAK